MRVVVTGDRNWGNAEVFGRQEAERQIIKLQRTLRALHAVAADTILVEGDARGADRCSGVMWLELTGDNKQQLDEHPANWTKYGKAAGPIRNQFMIDESARRALQDGHPLEKAIACHTDLKNSRGTNDMVTRLIKAIGEANILYLA